jgi:hypothetical protein
MGRAAVGAEAPLTGVVAVSKAKRPCNRIAAKRPRHAIDALGEAFTELKDHGVLLSCIREDITGLPGKLLDVPAS